MKNKKLNILCEYISLLVIIFILSAFFSFNLQSAEEVKTEDRQNRQNISINFSNGDHILTEELNFSSDRMNVKLPYAGIIQLNKEQITSIVFPSGKADSVTIEPVETDTVFTIKSEIISGKIISIDKNNLKIIPSYAPEKTSTISLDKVTYCLFKKKVSAFDQQAQNQVKIIFTNGDLLTGNISQYNNGKFYFKPLVGNEFAFTPDQYQTIHNTKTTRQFIEGGLAAGLVNVLKNADNIRSYGSYLFLAVIRGFIKSNDLEGAIYIFDHLSEFSIEPYIYQQLANEFYRAQQYELAVKAYKTLINSKQRSYYDYDKIIDAHLKLNKKAEAAELCEKFLEQKEMMVNYGRNPIDMHLKAANLYYEIKNYAKATEHLQAVITDKTSNEYKRNEARQKLIGIYKENGQLDALIGNYRKQLDDSEKTIGEGMLLLIKRYAEQGKFTKAKYELESLRKISTNDYIKQAEEIISKLENNNN